MRIAMIGCKGIPAALAYGGGVEAHVEELSTRLAMRGHRVTVYVRPYANPRHDLHWRGITLVTLPSIPTKSLDTWTHTLLSSVHAVFQPYDIVHYHGVGPSTLAWIIRVFKPRAKVIVTFHSRDRFHGKWGLIGKMYLTFGEWTSVRVPHATIAVSHAIQLFCRRRFKANAWHIPNGVDIPRYGVHADALKRFGVQAGRYFYTLSRLEPHKSVEDVIEAFRHVKTDMKLVIVGEPSNGTGTYLRKLERLAERDPRVVMAGRRVGRELEQISAHAFAMVHASRSEGLSVAVLEAMSYGKLVIMSDIQENLELVDHSGVAFPVGDTQALARAMAWAVGDPAMVEERGARARETVKKLYSWDSVIDRTEALYSMLKKR